MTRNIVIDPITRLSGLLKVEVTIDNSKIIDAKCSGNAFQGFDKVLIGKNPLETVYYTERICGICSIAHSYVSSMAIESTFGITNNTNSSVIRDFIHGCEFLQSHIRYFYAFVLPDYIKGAPLSTIYNEELIDYRAPYYVNERLACHYVEGLKYSSMVHQVLSILGSKNPHRYGINVGNTTINFNASHYAEINSILKNVTDFIKDVMLEDIEVISMYYSDYYSKGGTGNNYLSYGVFDNYTDSKAFYIKPSVMINGVVQELDESKIYEDIYLNYMEEGFDSPSDKVGSIRLTPRDIVMGREEIILDKSRAEGRNCRRTARYDGTAMEVGPLARLRLSGEYSGGSSALDRLKARVLECYKIAEIMQRLLYMIEFSCFREEIYEVPESAFGRALKDTTRGALGHWVSVENKRIRGYKIMTPSSWNLSPMDSTGEKGILEKALIGTEIEDERFPVEIGRIIRSFDPCISCATHVITSKRNWDIQVI